ncbi:cysteine desulfurase IscS [Clostridium oryzae]|uniref:Cysteine desulfurase IscS n=2 Tax=Clostridium oryzae TaxID=1450648 RepID=A0A1V4IUA4_9CLOT|nr:cysteine desulfurase IscS [Clostridium oryzae]
MNKTIYMDYAATTYTKPEVLKEMLPYFTENYGNPSSVYSIARTTRRAIDRSRDRVAAAINAKASEIFFTASGSEADNWALKGIAFGNRNKGKHIITTKIEHHAILHVCDYLEKHGFDVTYLSVDKQGFVNLDELEKVIRQDTILVSIMFANNEIGTIQNIKAIGNICKKNNVYFHTDAVQAAGHVPIDVDEMNIDMLSLAAHKFYGPKGIGVLYIRRNVHIDNLLHGGSQERGRRAGTENIPSIVGLGKALELAVKNMNENSMRISKLRDRLITGLMEIPGTILNGPSGKSRLSGNVNVCFKGIEGEAVLVLLDNEGICASSGSACTSGAIDPSHVLLALGLPHELAKGSLRLTLGDGSTEKEVDEVIAAVKTAVGKVRSMTLR